MSFLYQRLVRASELFSAQATETVNGFISVQATTARLSADAELQGSHIHGVDFVLREIQSPQHKKPPSESRIDFLLDKLNFHCECLCLVRHKHREEDPSPRPPATSLLLAQQILLVLRGQEKDVMAMQLAATRRFGHGRREGKKRSEQRKRSTKPAEASLNLQNTTAQEAAKPAQEAVKPAKAPLETLVHYPAHFQNPTEMQWALYLQTLEEFWSPLCEGVDAPDAKRIKNMLGRTELKVLPPDELRQALMQALFPEMFEYDAMPRSDMYMHPTDTRLTADQFDLYQELLSELPADVPSGWTRTVRPVGYQDKPFMFVTMEAAVQGVQEQILLPLNPSL